MEFPGKVYDFNGYTAHEFEYDNCVCTVVEPSVPHPGLRWVWKAEYFAAFPDFELEMLKRGYYFIFMKTPYAFGAPLITAHWEKLYALLTGKYGFAAKGIFFGLSVGGLYICNFAAANPGKVAALLGDNPVLDFKSWPAGQGVGCGHETHWQNLLACYGFASEDEALAYRHNPVDNCPAIAAGNFPVFIAAASEDSTVPITENCDVFEKNFRAAGGSLTVIRHPGEHHPHHAVPDFRQWVDDIIAAAKFDR